MLDVLRAIRGQIGKDVGDTIEVQVWKDKEDRAVEIPADFEKLLKKEGLLSVFDKLSYSHRKEYCFGSLKRRKKRHAHGGLRKLPRCARKGSEHRDKGSIIRLSELSAGPQLSPGEHLRHLRGDPR